MVHRIVTIYPITDACVNPQPSPAKRGVNTTTRKGSSLRWWRCRRWWRGRQRTHWSGSGEGWWFQCRQYGIWYMWWLKRSVNIDRKIRFKATYWRIQGRICLWASTQSKASWWLNLRVLLLGTFHQFGRLLSLIVSSNALFWWLQGTNHRKDLTSNTN